MHTFMVILTAMLHQLCLLEKEYSFIQNIPHEEVGQPMGKVDGTLDHHWNTIIMPNIMYHLPVPFEMLTQSKTFLPKLLFHMLYNRIILIS